MNNSCARRIHAPPQSTEHKVCASKSGCRSRARATEKRPNVCRFGAAPVALSRNLFLALLRSANIEASMSNFPLRCLLINNCARRAHTQNTQQSRPIHDVRRSPQRTSSSSDRKTRQADGTNGVRLTSPREFTRKTIISHCLYSRKWCALDAQKRLLISLLGAASPFRASLGASAFGESHAALQCSIGHQFAHQSEKQFAIKGDLIGRQTAV